MATAAHALDDSDAHRLEPRAWLPLAVLPAGVLVAGAAWPAWVWMWALAVAVYAGLKWLSFTASKAACEAPRWRQAAYLVGWPGLNAEAFFASGGLVAAPRAGEWCRAAAKCVGGVLLVGFAAAKIGAWPPLVVGWMGMAGLVLALHFGLFHMLSCVWRQVGIEAAPLMDLPVASRSLSDFWGRRWNRAFRDISHCFVYAPLVKPVGPAAAMLAVFLVSGVVHDVVISLPARGDWGLPTLYFLLQAAGLYIERSRRGKRWGLRNGLPGRLFAAAVILLPLPLLFHPPFVERVVVPMLAAGRSLL